MGIGKGCGEKMGNGGVLYCHMMMIGMGSNPIAEDEHLFDDVVFICLFYILINIYLVVFLTFIYNQLGKLLAF
jgi:hypothetical protein